MSMQPAGCELALVHDTWRGCLPASSGRISNQQFDMFARCAVFVVVSLRHTAASHLLTIRPFRFVYCCRAICVDYKSMAGKTRTSTGGPKATKDAGLSMPKRLSPRRQGWAAGAACKVLGGKALPFGDATRSMMSKTTMRCDGGMNGGMKTSIAWTTLACCPAPTKEEKQCYAGARAAKKAARAAAKMAAAGTTATVPTATTTTTMPATTMPATTTPGH